MLTSNLIKQTTLCHRMCTFMYCIVIFYALKGEIFTLFIENKDYAFCFISISWTSVYQARTVPPKGDVYSGIAIILSHLVCLAHFA